MGSRPDTALFWKVSKRSKGWKEEQHMGRSMVLPSLHGDHHPMGLTHPLSTPNLQMGPGNFGRQIWDVDFLWFFTLTKLNFKWRSNSVWFQGFLSCLLLRFWSASFWWHLHLSLVSHLVRFCPEPWTLSPPLCQGALMWLEVCEAADEIRSYLGPEKSGIRRECPWTLPRDRARLERGLLPPWNLMVSNSPGLERCPLNQILWHQWAFSWDR